MIIAVFSYFGPPCDFLCFSIFRVPYRLTVSYRLGTVRRIVPGLVLAKRIKGSWFISPQLAYICGNRPSIWVGQPDSRQITVHTIVMNHARQLVFRASLAEFQLS